MLGSSGAPDSIATRSDCRPAQVSTRVAVNSPRPVRTETDPAAAVRPTTRCPVRITPPSRVTSPAMASATREKSTIPVAGDQIARIPVQCGSCSRIPAGPTISRPGTPLAVPLRYSSSRAGSSLSRGRHDELAAAVGRHAVALAELVHQARTLGAQPSLEGTRSVVDARMDHPGVVAGLMLADRRFLVEDRQGDPGLAHEELTRRGNAQDAAAHDHDVEPGHARSPRNLERCGSPQASMIVTYLQECLPRL